MKPWRYQADEGDELSMAVVENYKNRTGLSDSPLLHLILQEFMMETENYLGHVRSLSTIDERRMGLRLYGDPYRARYVNWQITENSHSLTLLVQWENGLEYTDDTEDEDFL